MELAFTSLPGGVHFSVFVNKFKNVTSFSKKTSVLSNLQQLWTCAHIGNVKFTAKCVLMQYSRKLVKLNDNININLSKQTSFSNKTSFSKCSANVNNFVVLLCCVWFYNLIFQRSAIRIGANLIKLSGWSLSSFNKSKSIDPRFRSNDNAKRLLSLMVGWLWFLFETEEEKGIEVVERSVESVVERVVSVESLVEVSNGLWVATAAKDPNVLESMIPLAMFIILRIWFGIWLVFRNVCNVKHHGSRWFL